MSSIRSFPDLVGKVIQSAVWESSGPSMEIQFTDGTWLKIEETEKAGWFDAVLCSTLAPNGYGGGGS